MIGDGSIFKQQPELGGAIPFELLDTFQARDVALDGDELGNPAVASKTGVIDCCSRYREPSLRRFRITPAQGRPASRVLHIVR